MQRTFLPASFALEALAADRCQVAGRNGFSVQDLVTGSVIREL
jgi:hypothetical protein